MALHYIDESEMGLVIMCSDVNMCRLLLISVVGPLDDVGHGVRRSVGICSVSLLSHLSLFSSWRSQGRAER